MHWFWRWAVSLLAGCIYGGLSTTVLEGFHKAIAEGVGELLFSLVGGSSGLSWYLAVGVPVGWFLPAFIVASAVFAFLTVSFKSPFDGETRCRNCRYILRGITEPRCPECGERI